MTGKEARKIFIEYFKKHNHQVVRSSSLVPQDDPTLLFTNAGMVQFKRVFTGDEKREYSTAVTAQKCVRAGGKHNDLENVGYTARHHTFFEMLGNFSFGDYFKEKAVFYGWDLLTNGYGFPSDKLWVSVFNNDDEAYALWRDKVGVPEERIVRLGEKDNFWAMGDTGPCGPCSEIHIDRGPEFGCDNPNCAVGCDCDRYLELWNLVFMQFERDSDGNLTPLPKPSIDTGMGLERIASVLQNAPTNYDTDLFIPIMKKVEELSGKKKEESKESDVAMKVIADHSRAVAFLICDGILPSNEGRGYVLRRIMRRAIRYGRYIGLTRPFLHETVATVFEMMDDAYPELKDSAAFILNVVRNEEIKFSETLDVGLKLLQETIDKIEDQAKAGIQTKSGAQTELKAEEKENSLNKRKKEISGDVIFKLYDTFGFPVDIITDVLKGTDITLDMEGYHHAMDEQKARSKSSKTFSGVGEAFKVLTSQGIKTIFTGYDELETISDILLIVRDGKAVDCASKGDVIEIVTQKTPFYAESGGQAGDCGVLESQDGKVRVRIKNTIADPAGIKIHRGVVEQGVLRIGSAQSDSLNLSNSSIQSGSSTQPDSLAVQSGLSAQCDSSAQSGSSGYVLKVDASNRTSTALNHTATHILHSALRKVLGDHVKQAGSLVTSDRLRFDFTHFSAITRQEIVAIEQYVNANIRLNVPLETMEMGMEEAVKSGATALFEEKYGDQVRVVSMGDFSRELCGGTHTGRTGNIGLFQIVSEAGIASGVRRIEALTGSKALEYIQSNMELIHNSASLLKTPKEGLSSKIESLLSDRKAAEKEIIALKAQIASKSIENIGDDIRDIDGVKVLAKRVDIDNPSQMRDLADKFKSKIGSGVVLLGAESDGKALLICVVTKDMTGRFHAGNIVKKAAAIVGGGGGGRPDMAQAGGTKPEYLLDALNSVYDI
ncbi:MAG: alanine--tRNA ligase [Desulfamplus sp.]|nr:alanine--tRNA ligase [Desulfamplus sp.]